jgi:hypothetical protein
MPPLPTQATTHELLIQAEEAICKGQQQIRRTLQRMGATPVGSDTGSLINGAPFEDQPPSEDEWASRGLYFLFQVEDRVGGMRTGEAEVRRASWLR